LKKTTVASPAATTGFLFIGVFAAQPPIVLRLPFTGKGLEVTQGYLYGHLLTYMSAGRKRYTSVCSFILICQIPDNIQLSDRAIIFFNKGYV